MKQSERIPRMRLNANEPVMVLEESRQTEDDRRGGDSDDVAVRSLYGTQPLSVKRSTDRDVPINSQQNRQPGVDHTQDVGAWKQPPVQTKMQVLVGGVVKERHDVT